MWHLLSGGERKIGVQCATSYDEAFPSWRSGPEEHLKMQRDRDAGIFFAVMSSAGVDKGTILVAATSVARRSVKKLPFIFILRMSYVLNSAMLIAEKVVLLNVYHSCGWAFFHLRFGSCTLFAYLPRP
jgi:hypothetical protein